MSEKIMEQDVNARIEQYQNGAIALHEFILQIMGMYVRNQEEIDSYVDTMPHNEPIQAR